MASSSGRRGPLCSPVDPVSLFRRLAHALGQPVTDDDCQPASITTRPFPAVGHKFRDQYLLREVLRKYPAFDLGIDTRQVALDSFREDERLNAATNSRLYSGCGGNPRVRQVLDLAGRKAIQALGRWDWGRWRDGLRFGPGSTTRIGSENAVVHEKLSGIPHSTPAASRLAAQVISDSPFWANGVTFVAPVESSLITLELVVADRFACVPKNARTDRTIGIPPCMNIMLQLATGYSMRHQLYHRVGINLNDQTVNQERARIGSITGELATLDVKSASNSVTQALVYLLLGNHPHSERSDPRWYQMLEMLRVPFAEIDGTLHEYSLFSAMGNGYTFELESLIFWALAWASCEILGVRPDVSVYGDDIILPSEAVPLTTEVLEWCGFRLNADKSFWNRGDWIFRESCGKHWLNGRDVSPFYVDGPLNRIENVILLANNIVRWSVDGKAGVRDGRLLPVWEWVVGHLPAWVQDSAIPLGEADDGLIKCWDEACPSSVRSTPEGGGTATFLGWRARTASMQRGQRAPADDDRYLTWLYHRSYRRFSLPWESQARSVREMVDRNLGVREPVEVRYPTRKQTFTAKTRLVTSWPVIGPWVTEGAVSYSSVPCWHGSQHRKRLLSTAKQRAKRRKEGGGAFSKHRTRQPR